METSIGAVIHRSGHVVVARMVEANGGWPSLAVGCVSVLWCVIA